MSKGQMNIRIEKALKMILMEKDNYSEFVRDACYEKLQRENDPKLLDNQIQEHEEAIKQLKLLQKQIKKDQSDNGQKIRDLLQLWYVNYRQDRIIVEDHFNLRWIKDKILPALKKLGCTSYSANDILEIYQTHNEEGKVLINV